jgi:hypothetical protein
VKELVHSCRALGGLGIRTYSEDDGRTGSEFGRNIYVHLEVCWVAAEVVDAGECAICSSREGNEAADNWSREMHFS